MMPFRSQAAEAHGQVLLDRRHIVLEDVGEARLEIEFELPVPQDLLQSKCRLVPRQRHADAAMRPHPEQRMPRRGMSKSDEMALRAEREKLRIDLLQEMHQRDRVQN